MLYLNSKSSIYLVSLNGNQKLKFILLAPENHHLCVWKDQYASDNMATLNPDSNSQLNLVASCVLIGLGIYRDKLGFLNVGRYFARSRNVDSELL